MSHDVLLVDVDPAWRELGSAELRRAGIAVRTAAGVDAALAGALAQPPGLIVGASHLPGDQGLALCRRVRREPSLADVPVLLVDDNPVDETLGTLAVAAGAYAIVPRSGDFGAELQDIVALLQRRGRVPVEDAAFEGTEITERHRLSVSEAKYRALIEGLPDAVRTVGADGYIAYASANAERVCGFDASALTGSHVDFWIARVHDDDRERVRASYEALLGERLPFSIEYRWMHQSGEWVWLADRMAVRESADCFDGTLADIGQRKRLEHQVWLSQKMEAIGRLVGGVAHDFNNILATILANCHFLQVGLGGQSEHAEDVAEIRAAADRAAVLTRQLVAFGRRQLMELAVIDLNELVSGVDRMMRRIIGEDIQVKLALQAELGSVRADPGQIEQVLTNLIVNARDAMPKGGRLVIETANADLDEVFAEAHLPMQPGRYVMFAISDTGCGMDEQTRARAFEPFFTTKPVGKGTGLGLATTYGIIKQSGGFIWLYSEVGRGTTFRVYLPRVEEPSAKRALPKRIGTGAPRGDETILVVEDDERLRNGTARMLRSLGYVVLLAAESQEAFALARAHPGPIHLVLSDIVIPGMNGPELVAALQRIRPCPTLFMSGYTEHAAFENGAVPEGAHLLQKPFSFEQLAAKVRARLDEAATVLARR